jgi:hypothetical protein
MLFKTILFAARTKRGRRLLFLGALHVVQLAQSPQARRAYAQAAKIASDPRPRAAARTAARAAGGRLKTRPRPNSTALRRVTHRFADKASAIPSHLRHTRR